MDDSDYNKRCMQARQLLVETRDTLNNLAHIAPYYAEAGALLESVLTSSCEDSKVIGALCQTS